MRVHVQRLVEVAESCWRRIGRAPWIAGYFFAARGGVGFRFVWKAEGGTPFEVGEQSKKLIFRHQSGGPFFECEPKAKFDPVAPGDIHHRMGVSGRVLLVGKGDASIFAIESVITNSKRPDTGECFKSGYGNEGEPDPAEVGALSRGGGHLGRWYDRFTSERPLRQRCQQAATVSDLWDADLKQVRIGQLSKVGISNSGTHKILQKVAVFLKP